MQLSKTYTKTAESFELKNQGRNYITNSKQKNKVLAFFKKVLVDVLLAGILKNCSVSIFFKMKSPYKLHRSSLFFISFYCECVLGSIGLFSINFSKKCIPPFGELKIPYLTHILQGSLLYEILYL